MKTKMAEAVYTLSAATSLLCALLLLRGYWRSGARLLLWSSFCFFGLALDNLLLFVDLVVLPDIDLTLWGLTTLRRVCTLSGLALLLYGMVWDA